MTDNSKNIEIMPKTVRAILNLKNDDIINLCKIGDIPLKRNKKGLTYFTADDVQVLKRLNAIQNRAKYYEEKSIKLKNGFHKVPSEKISLSGNTLSLLPKENRNNEIQQADTVKLLKQITGAVKNIESGICEKFSDILETKLETKLEEKLGGIDDVIMDLVRSKAENESLRKQISENEKEIYFLKNELGKFKKITGSLYIKNKKGKNEI